MQDVVELLQMRQPLEAHKVVECLLLTDAKMRGELRHQGYGVLQHVILVS